MFNECFGNTLTHRKLTTNYITHIADMSGRMKQERNRGKEGFYEMICRTFRELKYLFKNNLRQHSHVRE
jgi:hypothetical protein